MWDRNEVRVKVKQHKSWMKGFRMFEEIQQPSEALVCSGVTLKSSLDHMSTKAENNLQLSLHLVYTRTQRISHREI